MTLQEAQSKIGAILDLREMSENVVVTDLMLVRIDVRSFEKPRIIKCVQIEIEEPGGSF